MTPRISYFHVDHAMSTQGVLISSLQLGKDAIDLSRIPLQCVRTIAPQRGWGGHFHTFTVFLSTPTSTRCYCLLECGKSLLNGSNRKYYIYLNELVFSTYVLRLIPGGYSQKRLSVGVPPTSRPKLLPYSWPKSAIFSALVMTRPKIAITYL